jgi:hypothetical protein
VKLKVDRRAAICLCESMVKTEKRSSSESADKLAIKIRLSGKEVTQPSQKSSADGGTKLKIKLSGSATEQTQVPAANEAQKQPAKKEKRTRKRKAPSPDEVTFPLKPGLSMRSIVFKCSPSGR